MHAQEIGVGGRFGKEKIGFVCYFGADQLFGDEAEFLRGKDVRAEVQVIAGMVDNLERKHGVPDPSRRRFSFRARG